MNKIFSFFMFFAAMMCLTSCDGHQDAPDLGIKVGHILTTDGNIMPYEDFKSSRKEAIGVVFHINSSSEVQGRGLAVYLHQMPEYALTDSLGIDQGTSASLSALDGNSNTFAMLANTGVSSPAAEALFDMWRYGQSAYIPSIAELRLLKAAKSQINQYIEACGGEPLGNEWVWSSTEVEGQKTHKAWLYSLESGAMQETPKSQEHHIRPVITLND